MKTNFYIGVLAAPMRVVLWCLLANEIFFCPPGLSLQSSLTATKYKIIKTRSKSHSTPAIDPSPKTDDNVQEAWIRYYGSKLSNIDNPKVSMVVGRQGKVYISGIKTDKKSGGDLAVVKFNSSGEQEWTTQFSIDNNGFDAPSGLALDKSENIYLIGSNHRFGKSYGLWTIKYDTTGKRVWAVYYYGEQQREQSAQGLAIDDSGNIHVAGWLDSRRSGHDMITIKYDSTGGEKWTAFYDSPNNRSDEALAIIVDLHGNVYTAGKSRGVEAFGHALIKYDPNGKEKWVARYNSSDESSGEITALAVDRIGSVYATGWSRISGQGADYLTIKYNANGEEVWQARYNGMGNGNDRPRAIVLDNSGGAYVTGFSRGLGTLSDYVTIRYDNTGVIDWVARYNGSKNSIDEATALALDDSGNAHITGFSQDLGATFAFATVKYNPSGKEIWVRRYKASEHSVDKPGALVLDGSGSVYVTGTVYDPNTLTNDYHVVKYDAEGEMQWRGISSSPANSFHNYFNDMVVDELGNIYIAGSTGSDYVTLKYNPEGFLQWHTKYDSPPSAYNHSTDRPVELAVDKTGNVYVTGTSLIDSGEYLTVKYGANGTEQWTARYNGHGGDYDQAHAIACDDSGNVYVTGRSFEGRTRGDDFGTVKYTRSGLEAWRVLYNFGLEDVATDVAVDKFGNCYVTGHSYAPGGNFDYATIKYNASGYMEWVQRYNDPASLSDVSRKLVIDEDGNVYVAGMSFFNETSLIVAIKYTSTGLQKWVAQHNPGTGKVRAISLALDANDNVLIAANGQNENSAIHYLTIKYNSLGEKLWAAQFDGEGSNNYFEGIYDMTVDRAGNVYVTGGSSGPRNILNLTTLKYSPNGLQEWLIRHESSMISGLGAAVALDPKGNVVVAGESTSEDWRRLMTIKYTQSPVSVEQDESSSPHIFHLAQNYPNPFNPSTTIRYTLARLSHVTLKIFSISGQEVATLVDEIKSPGAHEVQWEALDLPCGVYFYRLQAGNESVQARKLLLLK